MTQLNFSKLILTTTILSISLLFDLLLNNSSQACDKLAMVDSHAPEWIRNYTKTMQRYHPEPMATLDSLRQLTADAAFYRKLYLDHDKPYLIGRSREIVAEAYLQTSLKSEFKPGKLPDVTDSSRVFERALVYLISLDLCDLAGRIKPEKDMIVRDFYKK
jgi:hypothetical protein